jgi:hypothetical protein
MLRYGAILLMLALASCAGSDGEFNSSVTQQARNAADRVNVMMSEPAGASRFKLTIGTRIDADRTVAERINQGRTGELGQEAARLARANNATGYVVLDDHTFVRTQIRRIMQTSASEPNALIREWLIEIGNAATPRSDGRQWIKVPKS